MKTLLAAALLALPLAAFAGEDKAPTSDKAAQTAAVKPAGEKAAAKDAKAARPAATSQAGAKAAEPKKDAGKKDEKPCEPVKPCSID